jgi:hypothetical protein
MIIFYPKQSSNSLIYNQEYVYLKVFILKSTEFNLFKSADYGSVNIYLKLQTHDLRADGCNKKAYFLWCRSSFIKLSEMLTINLIAYREIQYYLESVERNEDLFNSLRL